jgi:hypothetical protein
MKVALLLLTLRTPRMALGTSIVAIKMGGSISISADSKQTFRIGPPRTSCKIYRMGKLYFTIAGLVGDDRRGFHPEEIVAANFTESNTLPEAVKKVEIAMEGAFLGELERLKAESAPNFAFETKSGTALFDMVFAEVREGVPQLAEFSLSYSANRVPPVVATELPCPDHCLLLLGSKDNAIEFISTHRLQARTLSPDALSRILVEAEVKGNPAEVGLPVVTMRLESTGAVWLANDLGCPINVPEASRH